MLFDLYDIVSYKHLSRDDLYGLGDLYIKRAFEDIQKLQNALKDLKEQLKEEEERDDLQLKSESIKKAIQLLGLVDKDIKSIQTYYGKDETAGTIENL